MVTPEKKALNRAKLLKKYWKQGSKYHLGAKDFISNYENQYVVIKYGGFSLSKKKLVTSFAKNISLLNQLGVKVIIVHGGGPQIEKELKKRKIIDKEYQGLRITTKEILKIVKNILGNQLNKMIVREINKFQGNAISFNGLNKKLLKSKILMKGKIGFVGNPIKLDRKSLLSAISRKKVPIVSPIGFDEKGNKYNINADVAAGFIAETLKVKRLLLLTDVEGVLDNNKKLIVELNKKKAFEYIKNGIIKGGMIPKVKTCFKTLNKGVKGVALVDGRKENAILMELLTEKGAGTLIKK
jgi:acetylglutamate kinase